MLLFITRTDLQHILLVKEHCCKLQVTYCYHAYYLPKTYDLEYLLVNIISQPFKAVHIPLTLHTTPLCSDYLHFHLFTASQ